MEAEQVRRYAAAVAVHGMRSAAQRSAAQQRLVKSRQRLARWLADPRPMQMFVLLLQAFPSAFQCPQCLGREVKRPRLHHSATQRVLRVRIAMIGETAQQS